MGSFFKAYPPGWMVLIGSLWGQSDWFITVYESVSKKQMAPLHAPYFLSVMRYGAMRADRDATGELPI